MRIQVGSIFTEVPDDLSDKGLPNSLDFEVILEYSSGGRRQGAAAKFTLAPFPGCCGVVVSTNSWVDPELRGGPTSEWFHELKARTARYFGYTTMLMTTHTRNIPQVVGASKANWKFVHFFRNRRTTNDIGIAVKDI